MPDSDTQDESIKEIEARLLLHLQVEEAKERSPFLTPGTTPYTVTRYRNIELDIRPKEQGHSVPHFHIIVNGGEYEQSMTIEDFQVLAGNLPASERKKIKKWFEREGQSIQKLLRQKWEEKRPSSQ